MNNNIVQRGNRKGKKMEDLSVQNVSSSQMKVRLTNNEGLQEQRKAYYESLFRQQGVNEETAQKYAQAQLENDLVQERVQNRVVCYSKDEAENLKKSGNVNPDDVSYLTKKQRKVVDRNKEDFYTDGKFDSEKYKKHFVDASGDDYCMNDGSNLERPEDHTEAGYLKTSDTRTRAMAKKAGLDTTNLGLKRAAHVAGISGLTSFVGGLFTSASKQKVSFESVANVTHNKDFISDPMKDVVKAGSSVPGAAIAGGMLGALTGLATIDAVRGDKDLFGGREPKAIIESRNVKGLDEKIKPFMAAIIADKNLTNDQKAQLVEKAIGKNSSSLANRREIAAMYSNFLIESKNAADKNKVKPTVPTGSSVPSTPSVSTGPSVPTGPSVLSTPVPVEDKCPLEDYDGKIKDPIGKTMYRPRKGECWRDIVVAKYGILPTDKNFNKVVRELKHKNGLSDEQCRQNIQPTNMALPDELLGYGRTDAKVKGSVRNYRKQPGFKGEYVPSFKENKGYGLKDGCDNNYGVFKTPEERDAKRKEIEAKRKAEKAA